LPVDTDEAKKGALTLAPLEVTKDQFLNYMNSHLSTVDSTIKNSFGDMERCQA